MICALGWGVMSLFGALPFYLSGEIPRFIDCWFETVSGFHDDRIQQVLTNVEALSKGLLYWRSFTHWIGGMGVLVFLLAVIPLTKGNGEPFNLMKAESPGPAVGKIVPKISETAKITYLIYIALTVLMALILLLEGLPVFDAVLNSFATAGTGGFGDLEQQHCALHEPGRADDNRCVQGALRREFQHLLFSLITKRFADALANEEFRWYWIIMAGATLLIGLNILPLYPGDAPQALRDSFFTVSSVMTTTGFCTADFEKWPEFSRSLLLIIMCIGASAGSTGGGVKVSRVILLAKHLGQQMRQLLHPRLVNPVRMDGRRVEDSVMFGTTAYLTVYSRSRRAPPSWSPWTEKGMTTPECRALHVQQHRPGP